MDKKSDTILIVEDDAGILELLSVSIQSSGYSTHCVQTGKDAINWLKLNTAFLVVLDFGLPDMNGKELIYRLIENKITIPPFIVSTGQGDEHIAVEMMKLGALDYIVKDGSFLEMIPIVVTHISTEIEKEIKLRRSEQELIELNQFNHQIIDSALEGIIVYDLQLNYVTWNPFMERLTGALAKDMIGKNAKNVFPFLKKAGVIENVEKALKGIIGPEIEFILEFNTTGKPGWVSDAISTLKNTNGEIIGAISIVRNITERKVAAEALQKNRDILKELLIDNSELILNESTTIDFNKLSETILKISGAKYASFNLFDKNEIEYSTVGFAGLKDFNSLSKKYLGYDFLNKKWKFDSERNNMTKDRTITNFDNLYDYVGNLMPRPVFYLISKTFQLGEVSVVKITKNDTQKGDFTLIFKKGDKLQNPEIVELFATQVGLFLERKNSEDDLNSSNSLLNATFESIADGVLIVDLNGNPTHFNRRFIEMWKIPQNLVNNGVKGEMLQYASSLLVDKESFMLKVRDIIKNKEKTNIDQDELADGRFFERFTMPLQVENNIVGRVLTFRDLTKSKLATEALQVSENRYRKFINSTPDFVFLKDEDLKHIVVNVPLCEYYQKPEADILGKTDYDLMDKQFAASCQISDNEAIATNSLVIMEERQGDMVFETVKFPVEYQKGKIGVGGFIRNISDRKMAEQALQNKMDEMTRFHRMIVGRELVMVELKKEINELLKKNGEEAKYKVVE